MTVGSGLSHGASTDSRWWLALLASLALHAIVMGGAGWHLPMLDDLLSAEKESHIEARLAAAPPPSPAVPPAPRSQPPKMPGPVPQSSQASVPAPADAAPIVASGPAAVVPEAPAAVPAASAPLPRRVRIRFAIVRGEQGFVVGRSEHHWTLDGKAYTLRAVAETTGLAALFKPATVTQVSEGDMLDTGLRPRSFRVERSGTVGDTATFDWTNGRVAMKPGPADSPAAAGMQDMLSMFWQIGLLPVSPEGLALTVATGKKIERFTFVRVGEETISTALGEKSALHVKTVGTAGGDATDIWIGIERGLPLRIRHTDRKGEIFDQVVDEMEIQ